MTVQLNSYSRQLDNLKIKYPDLEIILYSIGSIRLKSSYDLSGEENIIKIDDSDDYSYSVPYQMCKFCLYSLNTSFKYSYDEVIYDIADHNYVDLHSNNLRIIESNRMLGAFNTTNQSAYIIGNYIYRPIDASLPCIIPKFLSDSYSSSITFLYESFNRINLGFLGILGPEYIDSSTTIYSLSDEYLTNKFYEAIQQFVKESEDIALLSINTRQTYYNEAINLVKHLFNVLPVGSGYIKNLINIHNNFKIIREGSQTTQEIIPIVSGVRVANLVDGRSSVKAFYDNATKLTTTSYLNLEQENVVVLKTSLTGGIIFSVLPLLSDNVIITTPSKYESVVEECKEKYSIVYTEEYFQEDLSRIDPFIEDHKQLLLSRIRSYFRFTHNNIRYLSRNPDNFFYPVTQYTPLNLPIYRVYFQSWGLTVRGCSSLANYLIQKYNSDYNVIISQET